MSPISPVTSDNLRLVADAATVLAVAEAFASVQAFAPSVPPAGSPPLREPATGSAVAKIAALDRGNVVRLHIGDPARAIRRAQRYVPWARYRSERLESSLFVVRRVR